MKRWYDIPERTKINAYIQIAEKTGMSPFAAEKDWWVVQTLALIFDMEIGKDLVFKGGTSLSKAWGLLDRFSEDIDLAVDRKYFGFEGDLSNTQRKKLRKTASKHIAEVFYTELTACFLEKGLTNIKFKIVETKESDQDPRIIEIHYPNVIAPPIYLEPKVQVEIGCRSLREPFSVQTFSSLVDEHYADRDFTQGSIDIPTVRPERTLLEKVFLLHEEFQKPEDKIRVDRLSRHLYDIYQLSQTEFADRAINDKELYETIVAHRYSFTRLGGVDYNRHHPKYIDPIPPQDYIEAWKADYKTMQEQMIYGDSPSFDDLITLVNEFVVKLHSVEWEWGLEFSS